MQVCDGFTDLICEGEFAFICCCPGEFVRVEF